SDRYFFSSLAYQSLDCDFDFVKSINNYPLPEFLVYVDVSPEVCRQRMEKRGGNEELFDRLAIQEKIRANYERGLELFSDSDMKVIRIDGSQTPEKICAEITAAIGR
ncbi:MAG: deoxynucleoside kinase, partial [Spirochaetales bacterium]|nr:deoxynucleoside kinase [Spirochaetales bacterium]